MLCTSSTITTKGLAASARLLLPRRQAHTVSNRRGAVQTLRASIARDARSERRHSLPQERRGRRRGAVPMRLPGLCMDHRPVAREQAHAAHALYSRQRSSAGRRDTGRHVVGPRHPAGRPRRRSPVAGQVRIGLTGARDALAAIEATTGADTRRTSSQHRGREIARVADRRTMALVGFSRDRLLVGLPHYELDPYATQLDALVGLGAISTDTTTVGGHSVVFNSSTLLLFNSWTCIIIMCALV